MPQLMLSAFFVISLTQTGGFAPSVLSYLYLMAKSNFHLKPSTVTFSSGCLEDNR